MNKSTLKYLSVFILFFASLSAMADNKDSLYSVSASVGVGYGHFFNNFENVLSSDIKENMPSFIGRIMWEPDSRLKLGLESGYYFLFAVDNLPAEIGDDKMSSTMSIVPIFMNVTMQIYGNFYGSIASGYSIMLYDVKNSEGTSNGSELSLSNFATSIYYLFELDDHLDLGAEFRYMRIGLTEDNYLNLNVFIKIDFFNY